MDPSYAPGAEHLFCGLNSARNFIGSFDGIDLNVDNPNAQFDTVRNVLERLQIIGGAVSEFHNQMIGVQCIEESEQRGPMAFANGLPAVVAKAQVNGALALECVENKIDGLRGQRTVLRSLH